MTQEVIVYDPAVVDQVIAMLRSEHSQAVAKAGSQLHNARTLAIYGAVEPLSGEWFNDDRFWVSTGPAVHRYMVTTGSHPTCDCPNFVTTHTPCEHIWAVSIVCIVRFRHSGVSSPAHELQEDAESETSPKDDAEGGDVVARAIQDMEAYAQSYA